MTNKAVAVCSCEAPIAVRPAMAIPKVAIEPVVEATVPARKGASFSDREIVDPKRFCLLAWLAMALARA